MRRWGKGAPEAPEPGGGGERGGLGPQSAAANIR